MKYRRGPTGWKNPVLDPDGGLRDRAISTSFAVGPESSTVAVISVAIRSRDPPGAMDLRLYPPPAIGLPFDQVSTSFAPRWCLIASIGSMQSGFGCGQLHLVTCTTPCRAS